MYTIHCTHCTPTLFYHLLILAQPETTIFVLVVSSFSNVMYTHSVDTGRAQCSQWSQDEDEDEDDDLSILLPAAAVHDFLSLQALLYNDDDDPRP